MSRAPRARLTLLGALAAIAIVASACVPQPSATTQDSPLPAFPVTLTDDEEVTVTLDAVPKRIVTWAPSNTEVLFALGIGERVVGVSGEFDDYPPEARRIERVGGANVQPNVETVVALQPDLVLEGFGGGEEWKQQLREQGIPVFTVVAAGFEDLLHDIRTIGRLTGTTAKAGTLVNDMRGRAEDVAGRVADEERVTCFFEVGFEGGFFTVGPGSLIYDLLLRAGCDPVTADADSAFPQWSVEELVADDPD
ncbi:MAG TPA: helical backbone metal receptor, partial [Actinomycetota bacterium]|nr:helical backbone metal receptor [Actinomycetota bacterium]